MIPKRFFRFNYAVTILLLFTLLIPAYAGAETNGSDTGKKPAAIHIGAILPLSGELASKGKIEETAISLAVDEANEYLAKAGMDYQLQLKVIDSQNDPAEALKQAELLRADGTHIFITGSSAEVSSLKAWSDEQGTIVISYGSTAPSLGVANDGIFRVVPSDRQQANALATLLEQENMRHIIPVYRNDIYGKELSELLVKEFGQFGGTASEPVVYESNTTDFKSVIEQIEVRLKASKADRSATGIMLVSFDEANQIFSQAGQTKLAEQTASLQDVRWFGSDTLTLSPSLLASEKAALFAAAVKLTGVTFGIDSNPLYTDVKAKLEKKLGAAVTPEAIFAYDIPWMLAAVFQKMDKPGDAKELKSELVTLSGAYAGATGWMVLDEMGDRRYSLYEIWQVQSDSLSYDWVNLGKYRRDPGLPGYIVSNDFNSNSPDGGAVAGLITGFEGVEFDPNRNVSRDEFTYMLARALDLQGEGAELAFTDAEQIDARARDAVALAVKNGIVNGYEDGGFHPQAQISRAEMTAMVVRALKLSVTEVAKTSYADDAQIPSWARGYVDAAGKNGIIEAADDNRFGPNELATSAEATVMTLQIMKLK
ncbi:ABC transporter substrate-binding protein [Paenibacillus eucommiae]|uniref:Branched-chain amino acid transport system substrate-binding protein n=1 Tax=Paenibacillus eucommiae TaxID=1355755 RepID=A0ABS4IZW5_9BACL|nr:ABC transporter substrate-binding protein [Paenibacillus eucommiae]MBP1992069.1 branched-chain amino acid transport system substrate-binding protein [Paenibacillus eucommiae]